MSKKHSNKHHHNNHSNGGNNHSNNRSNNTRVSEDSFVPAKENTSNTCKLIAIDTNVFIDLSHMRDGERYRNARGSDARFYQNLYELKKMAEDSKVKFVILPTVFQEINVNGMSQIEKEFLSNYCVIYQPVNKQEFVREVLEVTSKYIQDGVMERSRTPYGDAMIMAEASVSGINLLTNNFKDFVLYDREWYTRDSYGDIIPSARYFEYDESEVPSDVSKFDEEGLFAFLAYKQRTRAIDIAKVNEEFNLVYPSKDGFKIIPMPFTVMDYVGKKGEKSGLKSTKQFDTEVDKSKVFLAEYDYGNEQQL